MLRIINRSIIYSSRYRFIQIPFIHSFISVLNVNNNTYCVQINAHTYNCFFVEKKWPKYRNCMQTHTYRHAHIAGPANGRCGKENAKNANGKICECIVAVGGSVYLYAKADAVGARFTFLLPFLLCLSPPLFCQRSKPNTGRQHSLHKLAPEVRRNVRSSINGMQNVNNWQ